MSRVRPSFGLTWGSLRPSRPRLASKRGTRTWGTRLTDADPSESTYPNCTSIGCPTDDGTDFLPGHGPNSSNADVGHLYLATTGTYEINRSGGNFGSFDWGTVAIAIELAQ